MPRRRETNGEPQRPDPDELLRLAGTTRTGRGRLKVYLGMAAGVGKTVRMLDDAHAARKAGVDIAIGFIEPHGRQETMARLGDLPLIPRKRVNYKDVVKGTNPGQNVELKPKDTIYVP